jgi:hypothetical protein|tara:strand:- start:1367 stop:1894 length:528 start_codon:yes stop_codon:yes gene_type:complete
MLDKMTSEIHMFLKRVIFITTMLVLSGVVLQPLFSQIPSGLLEKIKAEEFLSEGGCEIIEWNKDTSYVVGVGVVEIKPTNKRHRRRIGETKAKAQVTQFIEGSTLTTKREMTYKESLTVVDGIEKVVSEESFLETIQEDIKGFLNEMQSVDGWYSDDKSLWYHAVVRMLPNKSNK